MCLPQVAVGVGRIPGRYHAPGRPGLIHHDHLDAVEVIRCQSVLPAQVAEGTAEHVPTDSDIGADASWDGHSPAQEQLPIHLAERGTKLDGESAHVWVVRDVRHQQGVGLLAEAVFFAKGTITMCQASFRSVSTGLTSLKILRFLTVANIRC